MNNEEMRSTEHDDEAHRLGRASWRALGPAVAIVTLVALVAIWAMDREPATEVASTPVADTSAGPSGDTPAPEAPTAPAPEATPAPAPEAAPPAAPTGTPPVQFEERSVSQLQLPPPPVQGGVDVSATPVFLPRTVEPSVRNADEILRRLQAEYPPLLRGAGVEGTTIVDLFVDATGAVQRVLVGQSSGYAQLDEAATRVMMTAAFNPAMNRDDRVAVWVRLPVGFRVPR